MLRAARGRGVQYKFSFTGLEKNYRIFRLASIKMPRVDRRALHLNRYARELDCQVVTNSKDFVLLNSDVGAFMKLTDKKFDVIWLDLCAGISEEVLGLVHIASRIFNPGLSVFAINVQAAREACDIGQDRQQFLRAACLEGLGVDWIAASISQYRDTVPMLQAIFVRK